ncbi:MAG: hypothetical protein HKP38_09865 [Croceitalea sp.]|nr:hypothetical protein [Croceitalea sp.]NNL09517.1 hypothetical protein [Croceitalea sp.]
MNKSIFALIIMITLACSAQKTAKNEENNSFLQVLEQDAYFYTQNPTSFVINNQNALNLFYSKVNRTRKPGLSVPIIDFKKEVVLIACMGKQKDVELPELIVLKEDSTTITIGMEISSKKNRLPIISYPFCVYKMPRTKKEIVFKTL